MPKTKQVFISYDSEDTQFAHRLADDLQRLGVQVWIAPESIHPGEDWVDAIERGLRESSHMAVVLTPAAVESEWVRKETSVGIMLERRGRIQLIPLDVEQCDAGLLLSSYQMVSFGRSYNAGLNQLASILGIHIKPFEPVRPLERQPRRPPQRITIPKVTYPAVVERLRILLAGLTGFDATHIRVKTKLIEDLEMDELDLVELIMAVEDEYQLEIIDSDLFDVPDSPSTEGWKLRTVQDMAAYLVQRLGVSESVPSAQKKTRPSPRVGTLVCPECGLPFKRKSDLERHMANWHR